MIETNIIKVGIMSKEQYKKRTIAIGKGEYIPKKDEPKVWFESIQSMSKVLSSLNQELLKVIIEKSLFHTIRYNQFLVLFHEIFFLLILLSLFSLSNFLVLKNGYL